jgi:hypothetical protein
MIIVFHPDNTYPLKEQSTDLTLTFEEKRVDTVIDGCHVIMRFPTRTDDSALDNVRVILKSAYLKSLSG